MQVLGEHLLAMVMCLDIFEIYPGTVSHPREQDARFPEIVPLHA